MEDVKERYDLCFGRIKEIAAEKGGEAFGKRPERWAFRQIAELWIKTNELYTLCNTGNGVYDKSMDELKAFYDGLYKNVFPANYKKSLENPAMALKRLQAKTGQILSTLITDIYNVMPYAAMGDLERLTMEMELFVEIYCCFVDSFTENNTLSAARREGAKMGRNVYSAYMADNSFMFHTESLEKKYNPASNILKKIYKSDTSDLRYLYMYGEYIGDNEINMAKFLNNMPESEVKKMAETMVNGYLRGFVTMSGVMKEGGTTFLLYPVGTEKMVNEVDKLFTEKHLKVTSAKTSLKSRNGRDGGFGVANLNPQFVYDHRNDDALYFNRNLITKRLETASTYCEKNKELMDLYNGACYIETFGEEEFAPVNNHAQISYSKLQEKLAVEYKRRFSEIIYKAIRADETSFCIIAYPVSSIGKDFENIFADTVELNNLDNETYIKIQQNIIDVLNTGRQVHVTGKNGNETDITVALMEMTDPAHQTLFENCTADVNIPVGEVFTSPCLKGTNGLLHVKRVFLNGLEYKDLRVRFKDGITAEVTCKNFDSEEENKKFIYENLLFKHDFLPLGEFAIGTNTLAYKMANKYGIQAKMPILIAEKTGPHFAIGDTCYSRAEDHVVYNPDGKEIIARTNEISELRHTEPEKAYFNCHTDITIPYDELGVIAAVDKSGKETLIIKDGRFVVPGTEVLNENL